MPVVKKCHLIATFIKQVFVIFDEKSYEIIWLAQKDKIIPLFKPVFHIFTFINNEHKIDHSQDQFY